MIAILVFLGMYLIPASRGRRDVNQRADHGHDLWIIAAVLVIAGIVAIVRRQMMWGIVLIIVGLLVGPGGVSLLD